VQRTPHQIAEATRNLHRIRARWHGAGLIRQNAEGFATFDGKCPSHEDHEPSVSVTVGRMHDYVLHCHAGCAPDQVRADASRRYDIPEDWLGRYAAVPKPRTEQQPSELTRLRADNDRLRAELAVASGRINNALAVLAAEINKETQIRAELYLALTGEDPPRSGDFRAIVELAVRAGASYSSAKRLPGYWPKPLLLAG
jgi:hypothetical protein